MFKEVLGGARKTDISDWSDTSFHRPTATVKYSCFVCLSTKQNKNLSLSLATFTCTVNY